LFESVGKNIIGLVKLDSKMKNDDFSYFMVNQKYIIREGLKVLGILLLYLIKTNEMFLAKINSTYLTYYKIRIIKK